MSADTPSIETRGRGTQPLVLIHGWAMHGGVFAPLVEKLAERCTLYLVDLPGHGHARASTLPLELDAVVAAIAAATPAAIWLGWSLGGLFALHAAATRPAQVRALAMVCATPRFVAAPDWPHGMAPATFETFAADLDRDWRATVERFLALEVLGDTRAQADLRRLRADLFARGEPDPAALAAGLALLARSDLRSLLHELAVPSLWIAGRRDRLVPSAALHAAATVCGGAFVELEHAAHAPFLGHADAVATALVPLLDAGA
ncbi:MAG TPA: pimeloyl-ACP methyl ester esterase BioH [Rhodanobacteraceae bacterium]|nr:pimeloyl-ACP methyl ester esterase BioH [Rhodanobacteraceae bacterium]